MERKFKKQKIKIKKIKRVILVPLKYGDDLLKAVSDFCIKNNIEMGFVYLIGALQKARFSYFNQKEKKYEENSIEEPTEIVSCLGNISIKQRKPFVHLHISLADSKGNVFGGHLNEGSIIFAAECFIFELKGDKLERKLDESSNLFLWDI